MGMRGESPPLNQIWDCKEFQEVWEVAILEGIRSN